LIYLSQFLSVRQ